ncbi:helix-turn-helix transcriptional regulator [Clostridium culturomicium]|uniref:helix-turn-helix transcriptional regulator n=1 Tax=Clostridium culturomicium TaxID=1499683 RepID=UPI003857AD16
MIDVKVTLRKLRIELDVTQKEFAKLINLPVSTYRKKENGESKLSLEEALLISKIANKSVDEIFLASK